MGERTATGRNREKEIEGVQYCDSPIGKLTVQATGSAVVAIDWGREVEGEAPNRITERAAAELAEYFRGERKRFEFPIELRGSEFQRQVWKELLRIPWGEVRSYGEVAARLGKPKGSRAVGLACRTNPIAVAVPCHRVIGKNGALTGYWGGVEIKRELLEREGGQFSLF